jgi:regulator of protease activity HflC (stomatin/prohibitin superfamily)
MNWLSQILGFFRTFQFWIIIAPWEQALRVRLGKTAAVLRPGPHFRMPFIDRIFVKPVRLRTISASGQTMATRDGKVLTISVAISYAIADIRQLYMTVCDPEGTMLHQIEALIAETIAATDSKEISPAVIERAVNSKLPGSQWGLDQVKLMVTTFAFVKTFRLLNYEYRSLSTNNDTTTAAAA